MKIYFLNIPASQRLVRRYMCSSFPGEFLFPPNDMLALAAVARSAGHEVYFTDAVGEGLNIGDIKTKIEDIQPDLLISIISFELYDEDVNTVANIKSLYSHISYGLFGHYPTHFPTETLMHSHADFIMLGEPDHIFEKLLLNWTGPNLPTDSLGTVVRTSEAIIENEKDRRVPNPNILPMPAYDLLKNENYRENFMDSPLGVIQTARGCPYKCNYCVHSFGTKLTVLTPENVLEQILYLKKTHNIRSLRFIDDTFTAIPSRVIKICKLMIEHQVNITWTCLSRADTLDEEMLRWMKKAGCVRLNIGMESGSQNVLDILNKGLSVSQSDDNLQKAKKIGFEIMGFFLTGIPGETEQDIKDSISFARRNFHYIVIDTLKVYPGTALFDTLGHLVNFSLMPYQNEFSSQVHNQEAQKKRRLFYRKFYLSPGFLTRFPKQVFTHTSHIKDSAAYVLKTVFSEKIR